jgi:hypothetical protein
MLLLLLVLISVIIIIIVVVVAAAAAAAAAVDYLDHHSRSFRRSLNFSIYLILPAALWP